MVWFVVDETKYIGFHVNPVRSLFAKAQFFWVLVFGNRLFDLAVVRCPINAACMRPAILLLGLSGDFSSWVWFYCSRFMHGLSWQGEFFFVFNEGCFPNRFQNLRIFQDQLCKWCHGQLLSDTVHRRKHVTTVKKRRNFVNSKCPLHILNYCDIQYKLRQARSMEKKLCQHHDDSMQKETKADERKIWT